MKELQGKSETKLEIKLPLSRKLNKFDGLNQDVKDWIDDACGIIAGLERPEQLTFIMRHLEGTAKKEVKLSPKQCTNEPEKVFTLLREAFGETRSSAKIKRLLYERTQGGKGTIREFSRALLEIADKLGDDEKVKEGMLIEVLCENTCDRSVRREMKRMILEKPGLEFTDLGALAIKLVDSEIEIKKTTMRAHGKWLSFTAVSQAMEGKTKGSGKETEQNLEKTIRTETLKNVRKIVGPAPIAECRVGGVGIPLLLDSGSQVTIISGTFFDRHLKSQFGSPKDGSNFLTLWAANGLTLPYRGYLETEIEV